MDRERVGGGRSAVPGGGRGVRLPEMTLRGAGRRGQVVVVPDIGGVVEGVGFVAGSRDNTLGCLQR